MKKLLSYSQNGEDDLIWKLFDKKKNGLIIEVGAFDGIHLSNSYALENQGWQSILIEPHPKYFPVLKKNRPESRLHNCAVIDSEDIKEVSFLAEEIGLLSGINPDVADINNRYNNRGIEINDHLRVTVKAKTLNQILKEENVLPNSIDSISIDVEGTEIDVLNGFDIDYYKPKALVIECITDESVAELIAFFNKHPNYHKGRTIGANHIFVLNNLANKLEKVEIDCEPAIQEHPNGEEFTIQSHLYKEKQPSKSFLRKVIEKLKSL